MNHNPENTERRAVITILPSTEASLILRCDLAYHAALPAPEAAQRLGEDGQRLIDAFLPAFLTSDSPSSQSSIGSVWATLADLTVSRGDDVRPEVGFIFDLAPATPRGRGRETGILVRGSRLRLLHPYYEMWGYGYLAGIFFDLAVESGPMAGATVTVGDYARGSWRNGVSRRTIAAALIVPVNAPEVGDPVAARMRYEHVVQVLRAVGAPTSRPDGLPCEPIAVESDLLAFAAIEGKTTS